MVVCCLEQLLFIKPKRSSTVLLPASRIVFCQVTFNLVQRFKSELAQTDVELYTVQMYRKILYACAGPASFLVLLLSLCSVRAKSNFTPLNIILNTCTTYPCLLDQFYEAQPGRMSHGDSEDKHKLFQTCGMARYRLYLLLSFNAAVSDSHTRGRRQTNHGRRCDSVSSCNLVAM